MLTPNAQMDSFLSWEHERTAYASNPSPRNSRSGVFLSLAGTRWQPGIAIFLLYSGVSPRDREANRRLRSRRCGTRTHSTITNILGFAFDAASIRASPAWRVTQRLPGGRPATRWPHQFQLETRTNSGEALSRSSSRAGPRPTWRSPHLSRWSRPSICLST